MTMQAIQTENETYFFRTPRVWKHLEKAYLPVWYAKNAGSILRAWSAACSSGEEAHSLGILCDEFKIENRDFHYHILGTDISQQKIEMGSAGLYEERAIQAFKKQSPARFKRYMKANDEERFEVLSRVRECVRFKIHSLFDVLETHEKFDLIMLRNILIDFTEEDQRKMIANIRSVLKPDGLLVIGESEKKAHPGSMT